MVRPYGKGHKRRKKGERYDKEEEEVEDEQVQEEKTDSETEMSARDGEEKTEEEKEMQLPGVEEGIPIVPSHQTGKKPGVIFVLEKASLEVAKVGKNYQILNSEEHANFLRRNKKNPADYRPDIIYQALLSILDSPLNKAGRLRAVYVKTDKGVLFEVKPHVRIPRTYKRFAGIMLQLLQKLSITAVGNREKLLRVIKNPVTQYLPLNSLKIGFSHSSEKLVQMEKYVAGVGDDTDLVFVVGAMSHGKIECDYVDDFISVSEYPLSAAWCIARVCEAVSKKWRVL
ncbi:PREDICTED: ribosomal RNA small subunit methyltransferase nep-1-like [Populus euphratica]|uniref:Ribosomal RNA small subunit methyltransferase nep-1-like n=1 Tax=Populus euphratica TaxID=75702 RepID=A0AAJ6TS27_POPEU|nr:PREDICTED: ribosomal RNA small subunit methyltransferase nep-1-like [Populus euphratica]XP_011016003.1 PREDICTED: ribosomal RNA small subunit methyltransferase nep-1-like [Populus euphratica]